MTVPFGESDALAKLALEASGAGVWSWDATTEHMYIDDRYRVLYGFAADEVVTASLWQQRLWPEDRESLLQRIADCLRDGEHWYEQFRITHPSLGIRWLEGYGRVTRDDAGHVLGLVGINLDVTDRNQAAEALRRSEAQLKAVVDGAIDAIISIDGSGRVVSFNRAAVGMFKYAANEVIGRNVSMLMPEPDRSAHDGYLDSYRRTGRAKIIGIGREVTGRRSDGSLFPLDLGISEVHQDGQPLYIGVVRDITARKTAEDTQRLLLAELDHRVKNTLGTVQAMAEQTLRHSGDPESFVAGFRGRLQALSRAHSLLTQRSWTGVDLHTLVRDQLVLDDVEDHQIHYAGPALLLNPRSAVHLGLVLHELGTNARKFGALSVPEGRLDLTWTLTEEAGQPALDLHWREAGGPVVAPPATKGFGTVLVERGIRHTLRGAVRHRFEASGVTCDIHLPTP